MKGTITWPYDITICFWPKGKLQKEHFPEDTAVPGWIISNATLIPLPGEFVQIDQPNNRKSVMAYAGQRRWQYWRRSEPGEQTIDIDLWETRAEYLESLEGTNQ